MKYHNLGNQVRRPQNNQIVGVAVDEFWAIEFAAELNRLLAERDEARRDRDVLAVFIRGGAPLNHGEYFAALSRCTPPATEATNG